MSTPLCNKTVPKKSNGLITQYFSFYREGDYTYPIIYSNTNYKVIGGATVIDGIARRECTKYTDHLHFGSQVRTWTTEDIFVIGY